MGHRPSCVPVVCSHPPRYGIYSSTHLLLVLVPGHTRTPTAQIPRPSLAKATPTSSCVSHTVGEQLSP
eukprot:5771525-Prymnesium_polylepis.1